MGDACRRSVCDTDIGQCVKCLVDSDCRGDDTCEDNECIRRSELIEALVDDNGVLEWFFLEEDEDECASSANADSPNEITIEAEEDRECRRRGGKKRKGRPGPFRDASVEACADEDPADENDICICQRIVSDIVSDGTEYIQTCGRCEERGEDVLLDPDSKRQDREDIDELLEEAEEELGL